MRNYYEKRNLFYIQKHSRFLTHRCAQDSFEVRRRAPRAVLDRFDMHMGSHRVRSKSYVSVRGKRNKIFIFYIMRFVRAQLCASNIGNDEWLYKIQFPTILRLIHNIYHWTKIEEISIPLPPLWITEKACFSGKLQFTLFLARSGARAFVSMSKMNF